MSGVTTAPYGSWRSPIDSEELSQLTLMFTQLDVIDGSLYWIEMRPMEYGRHVLVRRDPNGEISDVTPPPYDVRSGVHEYGGRASTIDADGTAYFVHYGDQGLYCIAVGDSDARRLTPDDERRYLHPVIDSKRKRIIAVCEDHRAEGEPENLLVAIPIDGGEPTPLARGRDFYYAPALSPDGAHLAYATWDHPNMPWDTSSVRSAELDPGGQVARDRWVAGGCAESVGAPAWSPGGDLYLVSDRSDVWRLYRAGAEGLEAIGSGYGEIHPLIMPVQIIDDESAVAAVIENGLRRLLRLNLKTGAVSEVKTPLCEFDAVGAVGDRVAVIGGSASMPVGVAIVSDDGAVEVVRAATDLVLDEALMPGPELITFATRDGGEAHAFYYAPTNPAFEAPAGELAPLIVLAHSGPISAATTALRLGPYCLTAAPYWTSRGYAVLDVDYRGSTGYGRSYRRALYRRWGEVDVDDCIDAAQFLIERGAADGKRVAIAGGSAGGFTALAAVAFRDFFAVSIDFFGVSDLEAFARETHKYESHFVEHLVGRWPEEHQAYRDRSPLNAVEQISVPVLVAQGTEDHVVLPSQSATVVERLRARDVPVEYLVFEGEGHGFVGSQTLVKCLQETHRFLGHYLGFVPDAEGSV